AWVMVNDDGFSPVLIKSVRGPGFAFGAIAISTNKYVPLSLAFGAPTIRQPGPPVLTLAFRRFFPRINKRTGLTELPTHQLGGSTLRTSGVVCALTPAFKRTKVANISTKRFVCGNCMFNSLGRKVGSIRSVAFQSPSSKRSP